MMSGPSRGETVDKIYEAAVVPELWPAVLEDLTRVGEGKGALLFTILGEKQNWIGTPSIVDSMTRYIEQGWPARSTRAERLFAARYAGFLNDLDVYTAEEIEREPVFVEFLRPEGFGWGAATAIPVPSGDILVFNVEKEYACGPIDRESLHRLDALRPHLARSALFAWRLDLQRAAAITQALHAVGLPAAVLRRGGRLHAANDLFQAFIPSVIADLDRRLSLTDAAADALFAEAMTRISVHGAAGGACSIPIAKRDDKPPLIVHLIPVRGAANDIFTNSAAIVVVTPVDRSVVPSAEVIEGLFDLSPAEARVARAIGEGVSVSAFASRQKLSRETVRTHLRSIFAKTGVARQAELAALIAGHAVKRSE
jgi:DNA-binding CsgD family transcriptional regulator